MKKITFLVLFSLICLANQAQYQIGHRSITYQDPARSNRAIATEIYYPATTAGDNTPFEAGQFPLLVFGHGFVMTWDVYDDFWTTLVPLGYVMVFSTTESSFSPSHPNFGMDLAFLINQMKAENANAASPFYQTLTDKSAVMGHSMGGGSSFLACANNTVPDVMVTFAAANTTPSSITAAQSVTIPCLLFSGEKDCVAPPATHQQPMFDSLATNCKFLVTILNGGHCYFANNSTYCTLGESTCLPVVPISRAEQQATAFDILKPYLAYYLKSDVAAWTSFSDSLQQSSRITSQINCPTLMNVKSISKSNDLKLYPNPVLDVLNISNNIEGVITDIIITSISGKILLEEKGFNSNKISLSTASLPSGVYFLEVNTKECVYRSKFIKQ
ncbi:MAG: T9SS type A sorting domain-containing protein [Bacteroidota bacterium]